MLPAQPNQSILRGFNILQEVIAFGRPVGTREIARMLDLELSAVTRTLGTLAATGVLQQTKDKKYEPGPRIHVLSALSLNASQLIPASLTALKPFHDLGATVALGTLWRDTVVYFLHARADQDIAQSAGVHESYPANRSIIGKVLKPDGPLSAWEDRIQFNHRAWGARIGEYEQVGLAIVLPIDHELASPAAHTILGNLERRKLTTATAHKVTKETV